MAENSLKNKSDKDLKKMLAKHREDLREIRFGLSGAKMKDSSVSKKLRKSIARVSTELRSRA